jgi:hypothetical protein
VNHRRVTTAASVWIFDLDRNVYVRLPLNETPDSFSAVAYTGDWEPFTHLETIGLSDEEYCLMVHRPVPFGTGALRKTGVVLEDTHNPNQGENEC